MLNRSAGNPSLLARIGAGIAVVLAVIAGLALSAFFLVFFWLWPACLQHGCGSVGGSETKVKTLRPKVKPRSSRVNMKCLKT
ncbi:MAG: hypothetical protein R3F53_08445 [Gammaproteobacteria bacterium]